MLGLAIAAVIFLISFLGAPEDQPVLASVAFTFPFLWYWHWTWAVIKGLFCGLLMLVGVGAAVGGTGKEKAAGVGITVASPFIFLFWGISSALFIGAVYCLMEGIGSDGTLISQKHATVGAVLYGIGVFLQIIGRLSNSGSSSKD